MFRKIVFLLLCCVPFLTVKAADKHLLTIQKYDQFGSKTAFEFKFKIKNVDTGEYITNNGKEEMECMWDGLFYSSFELGPGTYEIENTEYPKNYFPPNQPTIFKIDDNTPFVDGRYLINDYVKRVVGKIVVNRNGRSIGSDGKILEVPLANYKYEIRSEKDIVDVHGDTLYKQGTLMDTITTGEDGLARSIDLPIGSYHITEVSDVRHYRKAPDVFDVNFDGVLDFDDSVIQHEIKMVTDHNPLFIQVRTYNKDKADPVILNDISFKLCEIKTNNCIKDYKLSDLEDAGTGINVEYGEYYLGMYIGPDVVKRFAHVFTENDDRLIMSIDFGEFGIEKGYEEEEIPQEEIPVEEFIELPKTGKNNLYQILTNFFS